MQFITLYGYEDIVRARIEGSSGSLWSISPPSREQMRRELQNGSSDITLRLTWTFQRYRRGGGGGGQPCLHTPPLPLNTHSTSALLAGTWAKGGRWSTPSTSTPPTCSPARPSAWSWPSCCRAPVMPPCECPQGKDKGLDPHPQLHSHWDGAPHLRIAHPALLQASAQTLPQIHPGAQRSRSQPRQAAAAR